MNHSGSFPKGVLPGCNTKTLRNEVTRSVIAKARPGHPPVLRVQTYLLEQSHLPLNSGARGFMKRYGLGAGAFQILCSRDLLPGQWRQLGNGPILVVGVNGMFTGGMIWILKSPWPDSSNTRATRIFRRHFPAKVAHLGCWIGVWLPMPGSRPKETTLGARAVPSGCSTSCQSPVEHARVEICRPSALCHISKLLDH